MLNTINNTTKISNRVKIKIIIITLMLALSLGVVVPTFASHAEIPGVQQEQNDAFIKAAGLGTTTIAVVVSDIIKILLSFLGVLFIVLIVYAGFMWMTSAGSEDKITKAKAIMVAAIIGLVIVLAAYAITYYVVDQVLEATKGGQGLD